MRILWLHQYFATPKGWGAVRTYEFARRFVRAGHAVDVVCCAGYDDSLWTMGRAPLTVDGVRVFVSGTAYRPQMGFARRVVSFVRFMIAALWFVLRYGRDYDTVIASSGPLTLAVPALASRWLWRVPFVFEVIDVWPDSAIAAGVLKNPVLKWLSFRLEAQAYRYAAAIVTCSTGMTERVLGKREGRSSKVVTISNCCDLGEFVPDGTRREEIRARYGVREDQMVVLYTGAMGLSNAVNDLVEAVSGTTGNGRIVWWFAGGGPEERKLREISQGDPENVEVGGRSSEVLKFGVSKVRESETPNGANRANGEISRQGAKAQSAIESLNDREARLNPRTNERLRWFGSLPKVELVDLYLAADVNVVTFMHAPLFYENSPNKFFDGIAAGLPTVFNRSTWLEPWLKEYDCGVVCKGDRPGTEMAGSFRRLADDPELRQRMGRNARRLAEEVFDRDKLAAEYLEILRGVVR